MCAKLGSNRLNTVVFRASYMLPILRQFSWLKSSKTRGGDLPPPWKIQNQNQFVFLSFRVDPLYWLSFIEIGEMACSKPAWCTHGHTLKALSIKFRIIFFKGCGPRPSSQTRSLSFSGSNLRERSLGNWNKASTSGWKWQRYALRAIILRPSKLEFWHSRNFEINVPCMTYQNN